MMGYFAMLVVGLVLGLMGGGGAILSVPILVYLFEKPPQLATSYSLFIVGLSASIGVWRYRQRGQVDYRSTLLFLAPSLLGTFLARRLILPAIPEEVLRLDPFVLTKSRLIMIVFACVMVMASLSMIRSRTSQAASSLSEQGAVLRLLLLGLIVGLVAGFVGAGGGFLIIPTLVVVAGLEMGTAVGTSLAIISLNSIIAFLGDLAAGVVFDWELLSVVTAITAAGLFIGEKLARFVPPAVLKRSFGWFVLVLGLWVLAGQFWKA